MWYMGKHNIEKGTFTSPDSKTIIYKKNSVNGIIMFSLIINLHPSAALACFR